MPLPLIPIIALVASSAAAGGGVYKLVQCFRNNKEAKNINEEAKEIIDHAQKLAVLAANKSEKSLDALGEIKLNILDKSVSRFVNVFEKLHNIELNDSIGLDEIGKYRVDKQSALELRKMSVLAAETLSGLVGGAGAGALTAFGAYGATMTFASASTGTAISTLSGIAAQNATLAFLGGGAIAAGGGGMAWGAVVLGGLVAGPALAVLGFVMDASAQKNLEKALSNKAEAKVLAEQLKVTETLCDGIAKRANMFNILLRKLDSIFLTFISQLEYIVSARGTDYAKFDEAEQNKVAMAMSIAGAVKTVLDTPMLTKDGGLTDESERTYNEMTEYNESLQKAIS